MGGKFFGAWRAKKLEDENPYEVQLARASAPYATRSRNVQARTPEPPVEPEGQLTVDVYQTMNDIVVEAAIAGVRPDDIDITVTPDSLMIRGARRHKEVEEEHDYLYQECYWGRFARSIILPQEVDPESADVVFQDGILTVRLPKANRKKMRKLQVRTG